MRETKSHTPLRSRSDFEVLHGSFRLKNSKHLRQPHVTTSPSWIPSFGSSKRDPPMKWKTKRLETLTPSDSLDLVNLFSMGSVVRRLKRLGCRKNATRRSGTKSVVFFPKIWMGSMIMLRLLPNCFHIVFMPWILHPEPSASCSVALIERWRNVLRLSTPQEPSRHNLSFWRQHHVWIQIRLFPQFGDLHPFYCVKSSKNHRMRGPHRSPYKTLKQPPVEPFGRSSRSIPRTFVHSQVTYPLQTLRKNRSLEDLNDIPATFFGGHDWISGASHCQKHDHREKQDII